MSNKPLLDMLAVEGAKLFARHAELTETWKNDGGNTKDVIAHELHETANQIDNLRDLYDSAKSETDPSFFSEYIDNRGRTAIEVCVIDPTDPIYIFDNAVFNKVYAVGNGQVNNLRLREKAETLNCMHDQQIVLHITQDPITSDITAPCISTGSTNGQAVVGVVCAAADRSPAVGTEYIIRRLTPLECERLQGFQDNWTDIPNQKKATDAARYKALGNSIALPPWEYVLQRLSICCGGDTTMASLFDGIGGFPLIWERLNGEGSCLWASEIEEFPIAVTKYHFNRD